MGESSSDKAMDKSNADAEAAEANTKRLEAAAKAQAAAKNTQVQKTALRSMQRAVRGTNATGKTTLG